MYTSSRCPLFLIDDLNFWIYFGSRLRFVPAICPRAPTSRVLPFGSTNPPPQSRYYLPCRCRWWLSSSFRCPASKGEESGHEGNDFEIFVAAHKFGGGGLAYLNMDRAFSLSSHRAFLLLLLRRSSSYSSFIPHPQLVLRAAADSYLTASLLPRFSSPSFRVPTSIVFGALINYPGATPCRYPLSLLLFLLASTRNESSKIRPPLVRYGVWNFQLLDNHCHFLDRLLSSSLQSSGRWRTIRSRDTSSIVGNNWIYSSRYSKLTSTYEV